MVDSPDLSLNISRELLQHDRQLKVIAANLEKKIKNELVKMMKDDREGYETFWKNFGRQIKFGVTANYGAGKDLLSDLLLFYSSTEKKLVTLEEYVGRMKEDQKYIYYAAGETLDKVDKLPQTELLKDKGIEILYFTEDIDEFCAQVVRDKDGKELRSILDQESEEGAAKKADPTIPPPPPHPPRTPPRNRPLHAEHPVFQALENAVAEDPEKAKKYAQLLYSQALLIAGLPLDDPSGYTDLVCELMK